MTRTTALNIYLVTLATGKVALIDAVDEVGARDWIARTCGPVKSVKRAARCLLDAKVLQYDFDYR